MRKKSFLLFVILCCITLLVACVFVACKPGSSSQEGSDNSQQPGDDAVYCTVTFNVNGGDNEIEPKDYAVGYVMNLPTPSRKGYTFVGWADIDGTSYTNASVMPNKDLTLYAQWQIIVSSYEDDYVYFKPATQGVKDSDTRYEYSGMTSYVYVELTSADLGGRTQVGKENNFDFVSGVSMEYSVKDGYTLQWYRDYDFSVANGAQRFTLKYGSNFQFLTVSTNQNVVATYLVDFYVLRDYAINLYSNIYAEKPYTTTYVVENRTLSADTTPYQLKDFTFDKRVYWNIDAGNGWGDWVEFNYSTRITKDWDLYQTYKPVTMTADLDGGTLEGELTVTPYTVYQQLPVPVKAGYDFIGWQLPDAQNTKENYFTDINGFNATQLLGAGGGVNGDVYFKTLKAVWSPKQYYKVTEGDTVTFKETVPVATYTDKSLTEINEIIYVLYGTDCIVPTKVVYDGAFEFCGWNSYKTDKNGDIYESLFNCNIKVTEPIAIYQDMSSLRDGTTLTALGLYLNGTRTFTSIGTGQRIKAWLPAKATYSFTVTTDNYVNFSCDSSSYNVTSSSPKTITVSCTSSLGQAVYFDVSSYGGSFSIEFNGPTGTTEGNPVQISSENLVSLGGEVVTPEKPGYTFLGWYDDDDVKISEEGSRAFVFQQYEEGATYTMKWQECATTLAVNDEYAGSVSGLEGTTVAGGGVTVTATTNPGYTFVGWYDGDTKVSEDGSYEFTFTMTAESKVYTAKWTNVIVESEDTSKGTVSQLTGTYMLGETVSVTATTKAGYTFIGWYNGDEKLADTLTYQFAMPAENVTYTAKWIKVDVESEDTNKGTVSQLTGTYLPGDEVSITATTKAGYTFIGWYNGDEKLADTLTYQFAMPAENVTYTAKWIKVDVESEDTNKGTVSQLTGTYLPGDEVSITATTKAGYTFIGWYNGDEKLADTLTYQFAMPAENVTYTAKWTFYTVTVSTTEGGTYTHNIYNVDETSTQYRVSFDLNGTTDTAPETQIVSDTVGLQYPAIPSRSGYVFAGWYDNSDCTGDAYDFAAEITGDVVLYAKWIAYSGSGILPYNSGLSVSVVSKSSSTKHYYAFVPLVSGSITIYSTGNLDTYAYLYNANKVQLTTDDDDGDGNNFSITYNVTAGTLYYLRPCGYSSSGTTTIYLECDMPESGGLVNKNLNGAFPNVTTGDCIELTATTEAGYTFIGWYNGEEKVAGTLTYEFTMPAENVAYTAKWIKVTVESEDTSKGTVSQLTGTYMLGETVSVTATTKAGYTFIGWYDGDEKVADTLTYQFAMPAEDVTYTAKWIKVTVESEDTSKGTISQLTGTYMLGETVSVTATTKVGYTFIGWYNGDEKLADTLTYEFTMPAEDVTYTAKWIICPVELTVNNSDAGTVKGVETTVLGESVTITATTKAGYTFIGWYNGDEKLADTLTYQFAMPAEDVTYTAKWIKVTVESEDTSKGTVSQLTDTYLPDDEVSVTATTKAGYTFIGWYNGDEKLADTLTYEFTMPAENVTYTAKWIKVTVESEDTSKGTVSQLTGTYFPGDEVSITATSNLGYTFIGWYDGDEKVADTLTYQFAMPAEDVTYTAKWIKVDVESEDTNKGTVSQLTGTYLLGDEVSITATSNLGYTFIGWYDGDEKVADTPTYQFAMPAENVTYTAKWETSGEMEEFSFTSTPTTLNINGVMDVDVTALNIPSYVTSISATAFSACTSLESISVDADNSNYFSQDGILYDKDKTQFVHIPVALKGEVIIADGISLIEASAFEGRSGLTSVTIPDSVTSIESGAFAGCSSLEEITIPFVGTKAGKTSSDTYQYPFGYIFGTSSYTGGEAVTQHYYGSSTSNTTSTKYYIPSSLRSVTVTGGNILYGAFYNCSLLTFVTIGNGVTSIESGAFAGCSSLEEITIPFVGTKAGKTSSDTYQYPFGYIFGTSSYTGGTAVTQYYHSSSTAYTTSTTYYIPSSLRSVTVTGGNILYGAFYNCSMLTSVTIPDSLTSIGSSAFYNCSGLTSITIPDSVTSIGSSAFRGCTGLTSITIPDSVTSIGSYAFYNCTGLTSVAIGDGVESIGEGAFYNCSGLTSITIPDGVTSIGSAAFRYCTNLTSITIPDSVTSIGISAFDNCSGLTSITIPNSVTSIGLGAFYGCSGLTSVTIGAGVTSIGGERAFYNCTGLTSIIVNENNSYYKSIDGNLYSKDGTVLVQYAIGKTANTFAIPAGVKTIGDYAFYGCTGLTSVTIGEGVTSIGSYAFYNCTGLTEINWNAVSVADFNSNSNVFRNAGTAGAGITVTFEESVEKIPARLFYVNNSSYRPNIKSVIIGSNVTSIGNYAFRECTGLTSVTIPDSVTSIGSSAFYNTAWYNNQPEGLVYIGKVAYEYNGTMPSNTEIIIRDGTVGIGGSAFDGCSGLTSITIPDSVTSIGSSAFRECTGLTSITIPAGVTSIGDYAFYNCSGLTSVTIGEGVTSIGDNAFYGCTGLTSITVNENNLNYKSIDGNVYSKDGTVLVQYAIGKTANTFAIPAGVKTIGDYAFYGCTGLTSVTIPAGVTSIGDWAFRDCSGLTSITIPDGVTSIGGSAFWNCSSLTSVTIGAGVTSIGGSAFYGCSRLTSVTFEETAGWFVSRDSSATSGTDISAGSLSDKSTAAEYLTDTYDYYYWKRNA